MGMFDTVIVPCPVCATPGEFQSKSGACLLETYTLDEAPDDVLLDVNRHAPYHCHACDARYAVKITGSRPRRTLGARSILWSDRASEEEDPSA